MIQPSPAARTSKRTKSKPAPKGKRPVNGASSVPILEWDELSATRPAVARDFWLRLKTGTFKSWTREGDFAVVSPTTVIESGNAALAWIKGVGPLTCRIHIHDSEIVKLSPEGIPHAAISVKPGDIAWMLRITALHHDLT